jgi:predicted nucleic acid-binding Zn ribbon protein
MPLYSYLCADCGAALEILHKVGATKERCGLDCQLQGAGAFGKGKVSQQIDAANVASRPKGSGNAQVSAAGANNSQEELRRRGLEKLGGTLSERDLNSLRDKGITVYRKDGEQSWSKDGGDKAAPNRIKPGGGDS